MLILLVAIHPQRSPQAVPLACAFLKEALLAEPALTGKVEVEIAEFFLGDAPAACAESILRSKPDLVGFSVYVWCREEALAIARELKGTTPAPALCAGGPEPTADPAGLLDSGLFEFVVRGEGESPLVQAARKLCEGASPSGLPGIVMPGETSGTLPEPQELSTLPSPYLSGLLDPSIPGGALWQLSRGCDFACAFCFDHKGSGGVRRFPMQRIEKELRLFAKLRVPQVFVLDSTFNKVPQRAKEILRLIKRIAPQVHFHFEVRSEFIDAEMAELFASVTCSLQIGLQSAHPEVLRGSGRGFDPEDFSFRISLLNMSGAIFGFDLIYGLPGDALPLFRDSLDFALSLYPNHLDIFPLAVLPGTRLYDRDEKLGLKHLPVPPYTLISTPTFPNRDLEEAGRLALACDIFYSRGKAVAWFNAVVAALKLSPSAFLAAFSAFLLKSGTRREEEIEEQEIWGLQREFLAELFREKKKPRLLPLALDLVDYHHHYACALLAAPPAPPTAKELKRVDLLRHPLRLAESAALAEFHYEILELLDAGDIELSGFASCFKQSGSYAIIYPAGGEVCTESIAWPYYRFLLALDGARPAKELCRELSIPAPELLSFLEFAASEGIVTFR
jgi:hypothetical protein